MESTLFLCPLLSFRPLFSFSTVISVVLNHCSYFSFLSSALRYSDQKGYCLHFVSYILVGLKCLLYLCGEEPREWSPAYQAIRSPEVLFLLIHECHWRNKEYILPWFYPTCCWYILLGEVSAYSYAFLFFILPMIGTYPKFSLACLAVVASPFLACHCWSGRCCCEITSWQGIEKRKKELFLIVDKPTH